MTIGKDLPKLLDDITELILAESDVIKIDQLRNYIAYDHLD